jgi:hypothetical protein
MADQVENPMSEDESRGRRRNPSRTTCGEEHQREGPTPQESGDKAVTEADLKRMEIAPSPTSIEEFDPLYSRQYERKGQQVHQDCTENPCAGRELTKGRARKQASRHVPGEHALQTVPE